MNLFYKIISLLAPAERQRARFLMIMILVMAVLDMVGAASILPFIAVLGNPNLVYENGLLNIAFESSSNRGIKNVEQFISFRVTGVFLTHNIDDY